VAVAGAGAAVVAVAVGAVVAAAAVGDATSLSRLSSTNSKMDIHAGAQRCLGICVSAPQFHNQKQL
jgi:hypothetical protein